MIVLRPGIHAFDGVQDIFRLTGLTIMGYGAIITSFSEVNETVKFTIRSSGVTFAGIEFDGAVTNTPSVTTDGCIEVTENDFTLQDCFIHSQNGYGVHAPANYDGLRILDSKFQTCLSAIFAGQADAAAIVDIDSIWINRNKFDHNRTNAVVLVGPGSESGHFLTDIQINGNEFSRNDTDMTNVPALSVVNFCKRVQIHGNSLAFESAGILLQQVQDASVTDNSVMGINLTGIWLLGCIGVKVSGNLIDGRNSAGAAATTSPILISGQYLVPNDAGGFVVNGNELINLKTNSNAISISNATGIQLNSNRIGGTIVLAAVYSVTVNDNGFACAQTTQAILIDASDNGCGNITISSNRFRFTGASISRCICTVDASATGIDDISIVGNSVARSQQFGILPYGHSGSNAATRVIQVGNSPENWDTTLKNGWRNTGANLAVKRVFVSQTMGVDATGQRQSRTNKFLTIAAAISAAISGDEVIVEDGTFNEKLAAKSGITVRFLPPAALVCTSSGGCIASNADNQLFYVYHEHTPILCTQNTTDAVSWTNTGAYLALHGSVTQSGAGVLPTGLRVSNGAVVEIWGRIKSVNSTGLVLGSGSPTCWFHGMGPNSSFNADIEGGTVALTVDSGSFNGSEITILGLGVAISLNATAAGFTLKRSSVSAGGSSVAIFITPGTIKPVLRDCVLVAGLTATQTISAASAQTIKLYGQTVANKGSDPPTNVTFTGGGTYDVSSDVTLDLI
jgi:hypothetical protein